MKHGTRFPGGEQRTADADPGSSAVPPSHAALPLSVTISPGAGAKPPIWPTGTQGSNFFMTVAAAGPAPPVVGTGGNAAPLAHPSAGYVAAEGLIIDCSAQMRSAA